MPITRFLGHKQRHVPLLHLIIHFPSALFKGCAHEGLSSLFGKRGPIVHHLAPSARFVYTQHIRTRAVNGVLISSFPAGFFHV